MSKSALQLLDDLIAELEVCTADLNLPPAAPAPTAGGKAGGKKEKKEKKEASPAAATSSAATATAAASATELDVNALDLRVGLITSVSKHATAEKLYCEEIDVGEGSPRPIASGLVPYYSLEEMTNRKVIVICNLKPRNLVGFKSHGMVLCASHHEGEVNRVEFVDPPANSKPGDRILGEGLPVVEPLSASKADKTKAWDLLAVDLQVNDKGEACWKQSRLVTAAGETCTAPTLKNVPVR